MTTYPKRLIEVDLPIARISAHARREKSIRHGHISTLHIWWARRPLAACRAVICAALWPDPADPLCPQSFRDKAVAIITAFAKRFYPEKITEEQHTLWKTASEESQAKWKLLSEGKEPLDPTKEDHLNTLRHLLLDFIADFANWDNSTVPAYLETSRALTQAAHEAMGGEPGTRPLVVDPFAGGGSIPLEALRVGTDAFASDLNPVAVLLNKVVLEYIPKYGQKLAAEVRKWGAWIKEQAEKELAIFYPKDPDGATPIAYLWARTILSEDPGNRDAPVEVPLIRSMWIAKRANRRRALRWLRDKSGNIQVKTKKVQYADGIERIVRCPILEVFEPKNETEVEPGTSSGGAATCPVTQYTTPVERVRSQLSSRVGGALDARLLCIVSTQDNETGRQYRTATEADEVAMMNAKQHYLSLFTEEQRSQLLPMGRINHLRGFFNIVLYGMEKWSDLFTQRQLLIIHVLSRLVQRVSSNKSDPELDIAIETVLSLVVSRMVDGNSSLARWQNTGEKISNTFGRQALPMVWDFAEANPFCSATRSLESMFEWIFEVIEHESVIKGEGQAQQASATAQPLPNESVNVVFTDPPYYAAVPYADLSDFFYSWLQRILRDKHPAIFLDELTPKVQECVQLSHRAAMYREKDKAWFERTMTEACRESCRTTNTNGIGVFVFASKDTPAWEAMLGALVDANWVVTASWPVDTEMGSRLRAQNSAALASSVHIVCRPRIDAVVGDWRDVLSELPKRTHEWMPRLTSEGIVGADAIFACLGPALEIFSRYSRVEKANGDQVLLKEYLEQVWAAVSKEALSTIFRDANAAGLEPDARLTAMWLWTLGGPATVNAENAEDAEENAEEEEEKPAKGKMSSAGFTLEYDTARKIAQGLGINLEQLTTLVEVKGDKARMLPVAERAQALFGKKAALGETTTGRKKKSKQGTIFELLGEGEGADSTGMAVLGHPDVGSTVLDRVHQAMLLFAAGRGEMLKRFLVEDGVGKDARFWKLADNLNKLYPPGIDERRWIEGVLARKKGLGL